MIKKLRFAILLLAGLLPCSEVYADGGGVAWALATGFSLLAGSEFSYLLALGILLSWNLFIFLKIRKTSRSPEGAPLIRGDWLIVPLGQILVLGSLGLFCFRQGINLHALFIPAWLLWFLPIILLVTDLFLILYISLGMRPKRWVRLSFLRSILLGTAFVLLQLPLLLNLFFSSLNKERVPRPHRTRIGEWENFSFTSKKPFRNLSGLERVDWKHFLGKLHNLTAEGFFAENQEGLWMIIPGPPLGDLYGGDRIDLLHWDGEKWEHMPRSQVFPQHSEVERIDGLGLAAGGELCLLGYGPRQFGMQAALLSCLRDTTWRVQKLPLIFNWANAFVRDSSRLLLFGEKEVYSVDLSVEAGLVPEPELTRQRQACSELEYDCRSQLANMLRRTPQKKMADDWKQSTQRLFDILDEELNRQSQRIEKAIDQGKRISDEELDELSSTGGFEDLVTTLVDTGDGTWWLVRDAHFSRRRVLLYRVSLSDRQVQILRVPDSFLCEGVQWMQLIDEGLWITSECGVLHYSPSAKQWTHYSTYDGLLSNNVRSIFVDSQGSLWFFTDKGLSRLRE